MIIIIHSKRQFIYKLTIDLYCIIHFWINGYAKKNNYVYCLSMRIKIGTIKNKQ
jgi:hypothetical protein